VLILLDSKFMASKILVSLVGEQTIRNIQLIKEFDFVDSFFFISTEGMEKKGTREWIIKSAQLLDDKVQLPILVTEHDFNDIAEKLSGIKFADSDDIFVNISDGTKIMSIVAFDFFKELGAKIFYVTGKNSEYIKIFPKSNQKNLIFNYRLSVKEYLEAYGFSITKTGSVSQSFSVIESIFNYFAPFFEPDTSLVSPHNFVFSELQKYRGISSSKLISIDKIAGLKNLLADLNFTPKYIDSLTKDEIILLSGGWFEEYIHYKIQKEFNLPKNHIGIGVFVEKQGVPNEFDVVFTLNNKFYTIECKTSVYYMENAKKRTTIGDFVYKCDSLQSEFGLYPITAIATLSALKNKEGKVNPIAETHYKRAELYNVTILAYSEIVSGKNFTELLNIS